VVASLCDSRRAARAGVLRSARQAEGTKGAFKISATARFTAELHQLRNEAIPIGLHA
jgi:hypothetical protein